MTTATRAQIAARLAARTWYPRVLPLAAAMCRTTPALVESKVRDSRAVNARWIIAAIARETGMSTVATGHLLGRDHSTIVHALQQVDTNQRLQSAAYLIAAQADVLPDPSGEATA